MPRDGAGNYTLAAGNPVVSGEVITPTWANPTMDDIGIELTDSLSRSGKGGMLVPFENIDGTIGDPGITWAAEPTTGFSRTAVNIMNASVGGIQSTRWIAGNFGFEIWSGTAWVKPVTTGANATFGDVTLTNVAPSLILIETDAALNESTWRLRANGGLLSLQTLDDAQVGVNNIFQVTRTASVPDIITFIPAAAFTGIADFNARANFNSIAALANNIALTGRIVADTGDLRLVRLSATDVMEIGQASSALNGAVYDSGNVTTAHIFNVNGVETARFNALGLQVGVGTPTQARFLNVLSTQQAVAEFESTNSGAAMIDIEGSNSPTGGVGVRCKQNSVIEAFSGWRDDLQQFVIAGNQTNVPWASFDITGIHMQNARILKGRNLADDLSYDLIHTDTADRLIVGDLNRLKGAIYHASDHRFLGSEGDSFHSTSKALGSLLCRDLNDVDKKMGFRNPTRFVTNGNATVLQAWEDSFIALNTGSTTLTFPVLDLLTHVKVINATGVGTAAEGAGITLQRFTGSARVDGNFAMSSGSIWEFYQITTGIWYCWEITTAP